MAKPSVCDGGASCSIFRQLYNVSHPDGIIGILYFIFTSPPPCEEMVVEAKPRNYMLMPVHNNYGLVI